MYDLSVNSIMAIKNVQYCCSPQTCIQGHDLEKDIFSELWRKKKHSINKQALNLEDSSFKEILVLLVTNSLPGGGCYQDGAQVGLKRDLGVSRINETLIHASNEFN